MKIFVSRNHLPLIHLIPRKVPSGIDAAHSAHQFVKGFNVVLAGGELMKPFPECFIEGGVAFARHQAGSVNKFFFGAEGYVAHTRIVYTKTVYSNPNDQPMSLSIRLYARSKPCRAQHSLWPEGQQQQLGSPALITFGFCSEERQIFVLLIQSSRLEQRGLYPLFRL
jgi:hypothetical protein